MKKFIFLAIAALGVSFAANAQNHKNEGTINAITRAIQYISGDKMRDLDPNSYLLPEEKIRPYLGEEEGLVNIIRTDNETKVILTIRSKYDNGWVFFSENTFLRDCATGDMYKVRQMDDEIPLAKTIYITDYFRIIRFTMIFPPLSPTVKTIDFIQYDSNNDTRPTKSGNWKFLGIDLSQYPRKEPRIIL